MVEATQFLGRLHRGGQWAYLWTQPRKRSLWYPAGRSLPSLNGSTRDAYFGVHPSYKAKGEFKRAEIGDIELIGSLFADIDAKDFGGDKDAALAHVQELDPAPSAVVDSGGGYHAYWFLSEPFPLDDDLARQRAIRLQRAWVRFTGGDQGSKDIAHILRLPGTLNHKYDPPRPVQFVTCNLDECYTLVNLESCVRDILDRATQPARPATVPSGRDLSPYVQRAIDDEVLRVSRAVKDTRNTTLNLAAFALGQLVGADWANLDRATAESDLTRAAIACGLDRDPGCGMRGLEATIRSGLDAGIDEPRAEPADNRRPPTAATRAEPITAGNSQDTNESEKEPKLPSRIGARLSSKVADYVQSIAPDVDDGQLRDVITDALLETRPVLGSDGQPVKDNNGNEKRRSVPALLRRRKAGMLLLDWLSTYGGFVQGEDGALYYFHTTERKLFSLDSTLWAGWLYVISGVNPASTDYAHLNADCQTAALWAPKQRIVRVASWDASDKVLRVSRFDGTVYVLDGQSIKEEANGEHVIFDDSPHWQPYKPLFDGGGNALAWATTTLPNYDTGSDEDKQEGIEQAWGLAYRAWVLASFFTELCPTRPLCVFLGEKGSGKSMALRVLLKLLFGQTAQISGIPDKPDAFTAAASAHHIYVLDNLDKFTGWLRDKLARIATGANDILRELYTTNQTREITYRAWVGITTRTPDTLQRDDLADRLLVLPVLRIKDEHRREETDVYQQTELTRDRWWGDVLTALNQAVASIRKGSNGETSKLRLADWELLGRTFAANEGSKDRWADVVEMMLKGQSDLLLEGDPVVEGLTLWLNDDANQGRQIPARELYNELQVALYGGNKPGREWLKSTRGLSRHIKAVRHDLETLFDMDVTVPISGSYQHITTYQFWPKGKRPKQDEF